MFGNWADQQFPASGHGRILAVNEGFGFRPLMTMQSFTYISAQGATPQSTLIMGSQLMYQAVMENRAGWRMFVQQYVGKSVPWTQLKSRHETLEEYIYLWQFQARDLEVTPTAQATLTLLNGDYDPVKGYWMQFAGIVPFFALPDWWDERAEWERC